MINLSRRKIFSLLGLSITFIITSILLEIFSNFYLSYTETPLPPAHPPYDAREIESKIGWVTKSNYTYKGKMSDYSGENYSISIKYNENGFREFDNNTKAKNVFFIGDSYTQAVEVSNSKTFYSILKDSLNFDLYAYGSAGYGNYQEFLIVKKYLNIVNPDIVILQLCSNDFIDNYYKLEETANYKVGKKRPYLTNNGEVEFIEAKTKLKKIKSFSKFLFLICKRLDYFNNEAPSEKLINDDKLEYKHFAYSVKSTELTLKKIKTILPKNCKLITFVSDAYFPQNDLFKEMCTTNNIQFIDSVGLKIIDEKVKGEVVYSFDGYHWNEKGHRIVAKELQPYLKTSINY